MTIARNWLGATLSGRDRLLLGLFEAGCKEPNRLAELTAFGEFTSFGLDVQKDLHPVVQGIVDQFPADFGIMDQKQMLAAIGKKMRERQQ